MRMSSVLRISGYSQSGPSVTRYGGMSGVRSYDWVVHHAQVATLLKTKD